MLKAKHTITLGVLLAALGLGAFILSMPPVPPPVMFFYTPTSYHLQLAEGQIDKRATIRINGVVLPDSVYPMKDSGMGFVLADATDEIHAVYAGPAKELLRQDKNVVAEGKMNDIGVFYVTQLRLFDPAIDRSIEVSAAPQHN